MVRRASLFAVAVLATGCVGDAMAQTRDAGTSSRSDLVPIAWRECRSSSECIVIAGPCCDDLAINRTHLEDARRSISQQTRGGQGGCVCDPHRPRPRGTYCAEPAPPGIGGPADRYSHCRLVY
jgi:hypothetical protein